MVVAGQGPLEGSLRQQFPAAVFLGHVDRAEVSRLLDGCRAAVMSSRALENAPLSVLEAMAHARPVVGPRVGGVPEIVRHEVDGLLVDPGDVDGFASAMRCLAAAPDRATAMGVSGQERVANVFSIEQHMRALLRVYERALADVGHVKEFA